MTDAAMTPERERLEQWSKANPRDPIGLIAIAAWCNVPVDKLPEDHRYHTCAATKAAWDRVAAAMLAHARVAAEAEAAALRAKVEALETAAVSALDDLDEWVACKGSLERAGFNMDDTAERAESLRTALAAAQEVKP